MLLMKKPRVDTISWEPRTVCNEADFVEPAIECLTREEADRLSTVMREIAKTGSKNDQSDDDASEVPVPLSSEPSPQRTHHL